MTIGQKVISGYSDFSYGAVGVYQINRFTPYSVPFYISFPLNTTQYLQADTTAVNYGGIYQKFNDWSANGTPQPSDAVNYKTLPINSQASANVSALLDTTVGATVQSLVDGSNFGTVAFTDHWFRDNPTSIGNQNGGTNAIAHNHTSPLALSPMSTNEGVLLNQSPQTSPDYYSVSCPSNQTVSVSGANHTVYFQNRSASGATVENPTSVSSPVVFTSSSAPGRLNSQDS